MKDGDLQSVVSVSQREGILDAVYYSLMAGRPDERRMYDTMRMKLFWWHMSNNVSQTVSNCSTSARSNDLPKRKRHLELFPAAGLLNFSAEDILCLLPQTNNEEVFITMMTDR